MNRHSIKHFSSDLLFFHFSSFRSHFMFSKFELCFASHQHYRSSHPQVLSIKSVLKNLLKFTEKQLCQSLFFNKTADLGRATLLKRDTPTPVFFCEFCKIFKNTFFTLHLRWLLLLQRFIHKISELDRNTRVYSIFNEFGYLIYYLVFFICHKLFYTFLFVFERFLLQYLTQNLYIAV